jgi:hypothetical protein
MQDYEKLGKFYLGKTYDLDAKRRGDELVLYDSRDLVTHAVCVGMTGSGKTGLCIGLLEEAAIDGIPAIVVDPKGDLSNLMLTFPRLQGDDFAPWVNAEDAKKKGLTSEHFAAQQAELWAKGLGEWGQDGARIQKLRDAADFAIYTPGSSAGIPVSVLKSLDAPAPAVRDDGELFRERIATTATSMLGLLGIEGDPIKSREHILLSSLLGRAWSEGEGVDLASLIHQIQQPPVTRIGVMDVETFFPGKDRFELAMRLNNLLASPGFAAWMEGEPLDIGNILYTPEGKPRIAIFSIAHLGDAERMFFVSMLMTQILGWTRSQSGTTSLRALVYMDEIAGYFPPVANPPSKQPMLTLMKQGRAFGVGLVLATQNPVDLDYKGLSNAGTWFIGRLQTERDKARVLDGLEGAAASASATFDRATADRAISSLGNRVFLMNNVREDAPHAIETRWCLSYLRGPMTRDEIKKIMAAKKAGTPGAGPTAAAPSPAPCPSSAAPLATSNATSTRPVLPPEVPQYFMPVRGSAPTDARLVYRGALLGTAKVYYQDAKQGVDCELAAAHLAEFQSGPVVIDWDHAEAVEISDADLEKEPASGAAFDPPPSEASKAKSYDAWRKSYADTLFRTQKLELLYSNTLEEQSRPGEKEKDFRVRLSQLAREQRDEATAKLQQKYASKIATLTDRIRRAEQAVEVQKAQSREAKLSTALSVGGAILGALFGRKSLGAGTVSKASTAVRGAGRSMREAGDVDRAEENVDALKQQLADLETQIKSEVDAMSERVDVTTEDFEKVSLKPKKTGITVRALVLAWEPYWVGSDGRAMRAWE